MGGSTALVWVQRSENSFGGRKEAQKAVRKDAARVSLFLPVAGTKVLWLVAVLCSALLRLLKPTPILASASASA